MAMPWLSMESHDVITHRSDDRGSDWLNDPRLLDLLQPRQLLSNCELDKFSSNLLPLFRSRG